MRIASNIAVVLVALSLSVSTGLAAPLGITSESAATVSFGYQFQPGSLLSIGVSYELPVQLIGFIDTSVVARAGYSFAGGFDAGATLKAVVFPSLSGGLLAAGLWLDVNAYSLGSNASAFKIGLGPMLNINFEPLYVTFSASLLALTNGVFGFDLGVAGRYYIDAFSIEASLDYNTVGLARANFGLRFTL
jgi:hypothetical protein